MTSEQEDAVAMAIADAAAGQVGGVSQVSGDGLAAVSILAQKQLRLINEVEVLEEKLKEKQAELKKCMEIELPNAMLEVRLKSFEMADGSKIAINRVYAAGIKLENKQEAYAYLYEHGNEALIKTEVSVDVGKGNYELAQKMKAFLDKRLEKYGIESQLEQSIHWQTLRAWVREQIEAEEALIAKGETEAAKERAIPRELFGVYVIDQAKITPKKEKKR